LADRKVDVLGCPCYHYPRKEPFDFGRIVGLCEWCRDWGLCGGWCCFIPSIGLYWLREWLYLWADCCGDSQCL